jgi:hypothetical protein
MRGTPGRRSAGGRRARRAGNATPPTTHGQHEDDGLRHVREEERHGRRGDGERAGQEGRMRPEAREVLADRELQRREGDEGEAAADERAAVVRPAGEADDDQHDPGQDAQLDEGHRRPWGARGLRRPRAAVRGTGVRARHARRARGCRCASFRHAADHPLAGPPAHAASLVPRAAARPERDAGVTGSLPAWRLPRTCSTSPRSTRFRRVPSPSRLRRASGGAAIPPSCAGRPSSCACSSTRCSGARACPMATGSRSC